ncbi:hypothetical protein [Borreliella burgdorferi]
MYKVDKYFPSIKLCSSCHIKNDSKIKVILGGLTVVVTLCMIGI